MMDFHLGFGRFVLLRPSCFARLIRKPAWFAAALVLVAASGSPLVESVLAVNHEVDAAKQSATANDADAQEADQDDELLEAFRRSSPFARPLLMPERLPAPFRGTFTADEETVVGIVGGSNAVDLSRYGYLDTLLGINGMPTKMRNLAWQADTVYQQQRPRSFYTEHSASEEEPDRRDRVEVDLIIVWLGQSESLEGPEQCDEFRQRYEQIVRLFQSYTGRVVLVTPVPFENPLNLPYDVESRNANLEVYAEAIRQVGADRDLMVVDLASALASHTYEMPLTYDGLHLNAHGQWVAAQAFIRQWGLATDADALEPQWPAEALASEPAEEVRQLAIWRNTLWYRFWRPANWAFLYGNRQRSYSSRSHQDSNIRWFPDEVNSTLLFLEEAERAYQQAAGQLATEGGTSGGN